LSVTVHEVRIDGLPFEFHQDLADKFSEPVSKLVEIYFSRATGEAVNGQTWSALSDVRFALELASAVGSEMLVYMYGFATQLCLEMNLIKQARGFLDLAWEQTIDDEQLLNEVNLELLDLEDQFGGESWKLQL